MREWYFKNKFLAFVLLVIVALIMHIWFYKVQFSVLIETMLFSLMAFVFFDWATDATTKKELFSNMSRMLKNHHDNTELGFERVILNAETIPYKQLITDSSKIYICQIFGRSWLTNYKRALRNALLKNQDLEVNFILYSIDNPSINSLANLFTSGNEEELKKKIEDSISICEELRNEFSKNVSITFVNDIPLFGALYVFDQTAIQIPLSTSKKYYTDFLAYEFQEIANEQSGYKVLKRQIEELIS